MSKASDNVDNVEISTQLNTVATKELQKAVSKELELEDKDIDLDKVARPDRGTDPSENDII